MMGSDITEPPSINRNSSPLEVYALLNLEGFLGAQGLQVPQGLLGAPVAELLLGGLRVPGSCQSFNGSRVPDDVGGADAVRLANTGGLEGSVENLPGAAWAKTICKASLKNQAGLLTNHTSDEKHVVCRPTESGVAAEDDSHDKTCDLWNVFHEISLSL